MQGALKTKQRVRSLIEDDTRVVGEIGLFDQTDPNDPALGVFRWEGLHLRRAVLLPCR